MTTPPPRHHAGRVVHPGPLPFDGRERVIRRAIELAETAPELPVADDEAVLVAAAAELGVEAHHVRLALAEERAGLLQRERRGLIDVLAGPAVAVATARVERDAPLAAIGQWLERAHSLRRVRADATAGVWVRRSDAVAAAKRAVVGLAGAGALGARREVRALATPTGDGAWIVRLEADVHRARTTHLGTGALLSGGATAVLAGAVFGAIAVIPAVAIATPAIAGGVIVAHSHRARVREVEIELVRVLDAVASGRSPLGPLDAVHSLLGRRLVRAG